MEVNLENLHMDVGAERVNSFYSYNGDQRKTNLNKSNWFYKILRNKYGAIQKFSQTCCTVNLNGNTIAFYRQILNINFIG